MAQILNYDYPGDEGPGPLLYKKDGVNPSQFNVDNSTVTSDLENDFRKAATGAGEYARKVKSTKFYDWKTKNKSFLNLYQDLYNMGISNNKFFLRLFDRDLQGIDPYSVVLPKEIQIKIYIECLINPFYWLREILRIPVDGMPIEIGGGVPYRIDRNGAATWHLFLNGIDHYKSEPRQQGKTQDCIAKFNYAYHFGNLASTILFFNKDQEMANTNLYRLKCQRDMMPSWLQMRMVVTDDGKFDKGIDNTKSIRNPVNGNTIIAMGKATSKEAAMKMGRGATAALQHYDEFDFIPHQIEIMNSASFAFSTAARNAKSNGALYGRILSSTPGDLDTRDGMAASIYIEKMLVWKDSMLDDDINKIRGMINSPAYNKFVFVEHSWQQLKLSMQWYEEQCAYVNYDMTVIMREIWLKRLHGSNLSPFKRTDIMYLMSHQREPIETVDLSDTMSPILIYEKIHLNKVYILAIDPAEGFGGDNNAFTLMDHVTQLPVAEFKSSYISQPDMCDMVERFLDRYCPKTMIVVENNRGRELINCLLKTKYKYQLYYDDGKLDSKVSEKTDPLFRVKQKAAMRQIYGLNTSRSNRPRYEQILLNIMEERKELLLTKYLVDDVCALIRRPNGTVGASSGKHDDNIMSYLMCLYVYSFTSPEILEQFGIIRGASDDLADYDDSGNLTEEATLKRLAGMMDALPDDLRDIIGAALSRNSASNDEINAYREIAAVRTAYDQSQSVGAPTPGQMHVQSPHPNDQSFWSQYDQGIWESNEYENPSAKFDIDDYI